jgi:hypothetical protein
VISRILGALSALALTASVGFVTPWAPPVAPAPTSADADLGVQQAVQSAFGEVLPDHPMHFALDSVQSSPVEGGGKRFDGSGFGTFDGGDGRFIAFTLTLSARGELVEFDYSTATPADDAEQVAAF